jgi:hypothetical protein
MPTALVADEDQRFRVFKFLVDAFFLGFKHAHLGRDFGLLVAEVR